MASGTSKANPHRVCTEHTPEKHPVTSLFRSSPNNNLSFDGVRHCSYGIADTLILFFSSFGGGAYFFGDLSIEKPNEQYLCLSPQSRVVSR